MKIYFATLLLVAWAHTFCLAQTMTDSIKDVTLIELALAQQDSARVSLLIRLSDYYKFNRPDSARYYANKALTLANEINDQKSIVKAIRYQSVAQRMLGNESKALQLCRQGIRLADKNGLANEKALLIHQTGSIYNLTEHYEEALTYFREAQILCDSINNRVFAAYCLGSIGYVYSITTQLDSALYYATVFYDRAKTLNVGHVTRAALISNGSINRKLNNTELALSYFRKSLEIKGNKNHIFQAYFEIAEVYRNINLPDSSKYYALQSLEAAHQSGIYSNIIDANLLLSSLHEEDNSSKALEYKTMALSYKDSLDYMRRRAAFEVFTDFDEIERQYELESAKRDFQYRIRMNAFLGSTFTLLVIAILLFRNNRQKQKSKQKIETAYDQLKSTQSQLIQSEKMASLGELTAGIAHEIQNPLNFVNNFSEVNDELIEELREAVANNDQKEIQAILDDLKENEQKIKHHGQRAEGIVKGMLLHSRTSQGEKELTDINALADEYLRLAYHGMRAKDKSFNADFKTEFDPNLPKINIVPQDIGRVLLNLINNAFYAVSEKAARHSELEHSEGEESGAAVAQESYKPEVVVSTRKLDGKIEISVKDNGPGIPEQVRDKIFQPFFTTKPTGSGTGLGLSLSYDIVKAHGGEIKVKSVEGKGSEFIVQTPANNTKK